MTGKETMQISAASPLAAEEAENDTQTAKLPQSDAMFAFETMR